MPAYVSPPADASVLLSAAVLLSADVVLLSVDVVLLSVDAALPPVDVLLLDDPSLEPPHAVKDIVITAAIPSAISLFNFIDETSLLKLVLFLVFL